MSLTVGTTAPDFTLVDQNREPVSLAGLRKEGSVLLVFYPFAFSPVCQGELCRVRDELAAYQDGDTRVVGISVDTPFTLKAWAAEQGYGFPLLSDFWPHGDVARSYGVFDEQAGIALRGTFLVDAGGTVRFAEVNGPREARDQTRWREAVAGLAG